MTRRKVIILICAAILLPILSLGLYVLLKLHPIGADVPLLKTPDWEFKDLDEYQAQLLLRRETPGGGGLLLKRTDLETVYLYDPSTHKLQGVTDAEWQKASGPISNCQYYMPRAPYSRPRITPLAVVTINEPQHQLLVDRREVATAGGYALRTQTAPSEKWVAVLSAAGPPIPALLPFGSDWILGQRYHEILSLPDATRVGKTIRFPVRDTKTFTRMCWSADDEFVVHTEWNFLSLVVVETGINSR